MPGSATNIRVKARDREGNHGFVRAELESRATGSGQVLLRAERAAFDCGHDEAGHWLLSRWQLPSYLAQACLTGHGQQPDLSADMHACIALSGPVADRPNGTLPRLADEIETRAGVRLSRSRLSVVLRKKGAFAGGDPATR